MSKINLKSQSEVKKFIEDAWLGLGDTSNLKINNSLLYKDENIPTAHFLVKYFRNPDNFPFLIKWVFNLEMAPFQYAIIKEMWTHAFPMLIATRGGSKSFTLALYAMLKAFLNPGMRVVITGAAFRQSKMIFDYCCTIWNRADILRSIVHEGKHCGPSKEMDKCTFTLGDSTIVFIPLGEKVRGLRSSCTILDEFATINVETFEVILRGFSSVSSNPIFQVKELAKQKAMIELGMDESQFAFQRSQNQIILSGTAYYAFNHFYKYWQRYKAIINSRGDKRALAELLGTEVDEHFDVNQYSIIRLPYSLLPDGFHDAGQISQIKATSDSSTFLMEYNAVFANDSNGFFKRTLIESCVVSPTNQIQFPSGTAFFQARTSGDKTKKHIIGIDPASERDNLAVVVLELNPEHARLVYCWTTSRRKFRKHTKGSHVNAESDFYSYVARKIRELMKEFPCEHIGIDSQGGIGVEEALQNVAMLKEKELPIFERVDYEKPKDSDRYEGLHYLERINFASADWVSEANHGLKMDLENKTLLFPYFDNLQVALALEEDSINLGGDITQVVENSLENIMYEIEELKNELTTIILTRTGNADREHFDTPEHKISGQKKGRLKKDRYSALLIANMIARQKLRPQAALKNTGFRGGAAHEMAGGKPGNQMYTGPDWYVKNATKDICIGIRNGERFN